MEDEEAVEQLLDASDDEPHIGLRDWTYERELLSTLVNEVRALRAVTIAGISRDGKVEKPVTVPFPETAVERVRKRREQERHAARVRLLLPDS